MSQRNEDGRRSDPGDGAASPRDAAALFQEHLEFIGRAARQVARRHLLAHQDADDFVSEVQLKLIDDDYAVLRRFEWRSRLTTYLTSVIQRAFFDFQIRRWGRWRPSAMARHLGPLAVELERLVHHQERSLDEACAIIETAMGKPVDRPQLASLLERLPPRSRLRTVGTDDLADLPDRTADPGSGLLAAERLETARRAEKLLSEALALLTPEQRLLVKLAFVKSLPISDIARTLGLDQRRLYRSLDRCLATMRGHLEAGGLEGSVVEGILGDPAVRMDIEDLRDERVETRPRGPSHSVKVDPVGADPT